MSETDIAVDLASLGGFQLDLRDMATNYQTNAGRYLPGTVLPAGAAGLMATLVPKFDQLHTAISGAQRTDIDTINRYGTDLGATAIAYRTTDGATSSNLSAAATDSSGALGAPGSDSGVTRFSGLQLPMFPDAQENPYAVRQVVTAAIEQIQGYDDRFAAAVGIKPAADYLTPLLADWEALQAMGQRLGWLGVNDFVTSENLVNGTRWLQSSWTGAASRSFGASSGLTAQGMSVRSTDLDAVAKIVENGGVLLERLAYNQAIDLSATVLRSITYKDARFPLGMWISVADGPMPDSIKTEVTTAANNLRTSADARHTAIQTVIGKIAAALEYSPGRRIPDYNPSDYEVPDKVAVEVGTAKFGFGDNIWWEEGNESAVSV